VLVGMKVETFGIFDIHVCLLFLFGWSPPHCQLFSVVCSSYASRSLSQCPPLRSLYSFFFVFYLFFFSNPFPLSLFVLVFKVLLLNFFLSHLMAKIPHKKRWKLYTLVNVWQQLAPNVWNWWSQWGCLDQWSVPYELQLLSISVIWFGFLIS
jgi:hypothetical protein